MSLKFDVSFLTPEEDAVILAVLRRDEAIRKVEETRVKRLRRKSEGGNEKQMLRTRIFTGEWIEQLTAPGRRVVKSISEALHKVITVKTTTVTTTELIVNDGRGARGIGRELETESRGLDFRHHYHTETTSHTVTGEDDHITHNVTDNSSMVVSDEGGESRAPRSHRSTGNGATFSAGMHNHRSGDGSELIHQSMVTSDSPAEALQTTSSNSLQNELHDRVLLESSLEDDLADVGSDEVSGPDHSMKKMDIIDWMKTDLALAMESAVTAKKRRKRQAIKEEVIIPAKAHDQHEQPAAQIADAEQAKNILAIHMADDLQANSEQESPKYTGHDADIESDVVPVKAQKIQVGLNVNELFLEKAADKASIYEDKPSENVSMAEETDPDANSTENLTVNTVTCSSSSDQLIAECSESQDHDEDIAKQSPEAVAGEEPDIIDHVTEASEISHQGTHDENLCADNAASAEHLSLPDKESSRLSSASDDSSIGEDQMSLMQFLESLPSAKALRSPRGHPSPRLSRQISIDSITSNDAVVNLLEDMVTKVEDNASISAAVDSAVIKIDETNEEFENYPASNMILPETEISESNVEPSAAQDASNSVLEKDNKSSIEVKEMEETMTSIHVSDVMNQMEGNYETESDKQDVKIVVDHDLREVSENKDLHQKCGDISSSAAADSGVTVLPSPTNTDVDNTTTSDTANRDAAGDNVSLHSFETDAFATTQIELDSSGDSATAEEGVLFAETGRVENVIAYDATVDYSPKQTVDEIAVASELYPDSDSNDGAPFELEDIASSIDSYGSSNPSAYADSYLRYDELLNVSNAGILQDPEHIPTILVTDYDEDLSEMTLTRYVRQSESWSSDLYISDEDEVEYNRESSWSRDDTEDTVQDEETVDSLPDSLRQSSRNSDFIDASDFHSVPDSENDSSHIPYDIQAESFTKNEENIDYTETPQSADQCTLSQDSHVEDTTPVSEEYDAEVEQLEADIEQSVDSPEEPGVIDDADASEPVFMLGNNHYVSYNVDEDDEIVMYHQESSNVPDSPMNFVRNLYPIEEEHEPDEDQTNFQENESSAADNSQTEPYIEESVTVFTPVDSQRGKEGRPMSVNDQTLKERSIDDISQSNVTDNNVIQSVVTSDAVGGGDNNMETVKSVDGEMHKISTIHDVEVKTPQVDIEQADEQSFTEQTSLTSLSDEIPPDDVNTQADEGTTLPVTDAVDPVSVCDTTKTKFSVTDELEDEVNIGHSQADSPLESVKEIHAATHGQELEVLTGDELSPTLDNNLNEPTQQESIDHEEHHSDPDFKENDSDRNTKSLGELMLTNTEIFTGDVAIHAEKGVMIHTPADESDVETQGAERTHDIEIDGSISEHTSDNSAIVTELQTIEHTESSSSRVADTLDSAVSHSLNEADKDPEKLEEQVNFSGSTIWYVDAMHGMNENAEAQSSDFVLPDVSKETIPPGHDIEQTEEISASEMIENQLSTVTDTNETPSSKLASPDSESVEKVTLYDIYPVDAESTIDSQTANIHEVDSQSKNVDPGQNVEDSIAYSSMPGIVPLVLSTNTQFESNQQTQDTFADTVQNSEYHEDGFRDDEVQKTVAPQFDPDGIEEASIEIGGASYKQPLSSTDFATKSLIEEFSEQAVAHVESNVCEMSDTSTLSTEETITRVLAEEKMQVSEMADTSAQLVDESTEKSLTQLQSEVSAKAITNKSAEPARTQIESEVSEVADSSSPLLEEFAEHALTQDESHKFELTDAHASLPEAFSKESKTRDESEVTDMADRSMSLIEESGEQSSIQNESPKSENADSSRPLTEESTEKVQTQLESEVSEVTDSSTPLTEESTEKNLTQEESHLSEMVDAPTPPRTEKFTDHDLNQDESHRFTPLTEDSTEHASTQVKSHIPKISDKFISRTEAFTEEARHPVESKVSELIDPSTPPIEELIAQVLTPEESHVAEMDDTSTPQTGESSEEVQNHDESKVSDMAVIFTPLIEDSTEQAFAEVEPDISEMGDTLIPESEECTDETHTQVESKVIEMTFTPIPSTEEFPEGAQTPVESKVPDMPDTFTPLIEESAEHTLKQDEPGESAIDDAPRLLIGQSADQPLNRDESKTLDISDDESPKSSISPRRKTVKKKKAMTDKSQDITKKSLRKKVIRKSLKDQETTITDDPEILISTHQASPGTNAELNENKTQEYDTEKMVQVDLTNATKTDTAVKLAKRKTIKKKKGKDESQISLSKKKIIKRKIQNESSPGEQALFAPGSTEQASFDGEPNVHASDISAPEIVDTSMPANQESIVQALIQDELKVSEMTYTSGPPIEELSEHALPQVESQVSEMMAVVSTSLIEESTEQVLSSQDESHISENADTSTLPIEEARFRVESEVTDSSTLPIEEARFRVESDVTDSSTPLIEESVKQATTQDELHISEIAESESTEQALTQDQSHVSERADISTPSTEVSTEQASTQDESHISEIADTMIQESIEQASTQDESHVSENARSFMPPPFESNEQASNRDELHVYDIADTSVPVIGESAKQALTQDESHLSEMFDISTPPTKESTEQNLAQDEFHKSENADTTTSLIKECIEQALTQDESHISENADRTSPPPTKGCTEQASTEAESRISEIADSSTPLVEEYAKRATTQEDESHISGTADTSTQQTEEAQTPVKPEVADSSTPPIEASIEQTSTQDESHVSENAHSFVPPTVESTKQASNHDELHVYDIADTSVPVIGESAEQALTQDESHLSEMFDISTPPAEESTEQNLAQDEFYTSENADTTRSLIDEATEQALTQDESHISEKADISTPPPTEGSSEQVSTETESHISEIADSPTPLVEEYAKRATTQDGSHISGTADTSTQQTEEAQTPVESEVADSSTPLSEASIEQTSTHDESHVSENARSFMPPTVESTEQASHHDELHVYDIADTSAPVIGESTEQALTQDESLISEMFDISTPQTEESTEQNLAYAPQTEEAQTPVESEVADSSTPMIEESIEQASTLENLHISENADTITSPTEESTEQALTQDELHISEKADISTPPTEESTVQALVQDESQTSDIADTPTPLIEESIGQASTQHEWYISEKADISTPPTEESTVQVLVPDELQTSEITDTSTPLIEESIEQASTHDESFISEKTDVSTPSTGVSNVQALLQDESQTSEITDASTPLIDQSTEQALSQDESHISDNAEAFISPTGESTEQVLSQDDTFASQTEEAQTPVESEVADSSTPLIEKSTKHALTPDESYLSDNVDTLISLTVEFTEAALTQDELNTLDNADAATKQALAQHESLTSEQADTAVQQTEEFAEEAQTQLESKVSDMDDTPTPHIEEPTEHVLIQDVPLESAMDDASKLIIVESSDKSLNKDESMTSEISKARESADEESPKPSSLPRRITIKKKKTTTDKPQDVTKKSIRKKMIKKSAKDQETAITDDSENVISIHQACPGMNAELNENKSQEYESEGTLQVDLTNATNTDTVATLAKRKTIKKKKGKDESQSSTSKKKIIKRKKNNESASSQQESFSSESTEQASLDGEPYVNATDISVPVMADASMPATEESIAPPLTEDELQVSGMTVTSAPTTEVSTEQSLPQGESRSSEMPDISTSLIEDSTEQDLTQDESHISEYADTSTPPTKEFTEEIMNQVESHVTKIEDTNTAMIGGSIEQVLTIDEPQASEMADTSTPTIEEYSERAFPQEDSQLSEIAGTYISATEESTEQAMTQGEPQAHEITDTSAVTTQEYSEYALPQQDSQLTEISDTSTPATEDSVDQALIQDEIKTLESSKTTKSADDTPQKPSPRRVTIKKKKTASTKQQDIAKKSIRRKVITKSAKDQKITITENSEIVSNQESSSSNAELNENTIQGCDSDGSQQRPEIDDTIGPSSDSTYKMITECELSIPPVEDNASNCESAIADPHRELVADEGPGVLDSASEYAGDGPFTSDIPQSLPLYSTDHATMANETPILILTSPSNTETEIKAEVSIFEKKTKKSRRKSLIRRRISGATDETSSNDGVLESSEDNLSDKEGFSYYLAAEELENLSESGDVADHSVEFDTETLAGDAVKDENESKPDTIGGAALEEKDLDISTPVVDQASDDDRSQTQVKKITKKSKKTVKSVKRKVIKKVQPKGDDTIKTGELADYPTVLESSVTDDTVSHDMPSSHAIENTEVASQEQSESDRAGTTHEIHTDDKCDGENNESGARTELPQRKVRRKTVKMRKQTTDGSTDKKSVKKRVVKKMQLVSDQTTVEATDIEVQPDANTLSSEQVIQTRVNIQVDDNEVGDEGFSIEDRDKLSTEVQSQISDAVTDSDGSSSQFQSVSEDLTVEQQSTINRETVCDDEMKLVTSGVSVAADAADTSSVVSPVPFDNASRKIKKIKTSSRKKDAEKTPSIKRVPKPTNANDPISTDSHSPVMSPHAIDVIEKPDSDIHDSVSEASATHSASGIDAQYVESGVVAQSTPVQFKTNAEICDSNTDEQSNRSMSVTKISSNKVDQDLAANTHELEQACEPIESIDAAVEELGSADNITSETGNQPVEVEGTAPTEIFQETQDRDQSLTNLSSPTYDTSLARSLENETIYEESADGTRANKHNSGEEFNPIAESSTGHDSNSQTPSKPGYADSISDPVTADHEISPDPPKVKKSIRKIKTKKSNRESAAGGEVDASPRPKSARRKVIKKGPRDSPKLDTESAEVSESSNVEHIPDSTHVVLEGESHVEQSAMSQIPVDESAQLKQEETATTAPVKAVKKVKKSTNKVPADADSKGDSSKKTTVRRKVVKKAHKPADPEGDDRT